MTGTPSPSGGRWPLTFGLGSLLLLTLAIACEMVAIRKAEDWGTFPAAAICVVTGTAIGLIELRRATGFGTLRGRLFQGAIGGLCGGVAFALLTITLERLALGDWPAPWLNLAARLGSWLLWGGLAGGVLGAVVDVCLARRAPRRVLRTDPRAGEFLARLPEATEQPSTGSRSQD